MALKTDKANLILPFLLFSPNLNVHNVGVEISIRPRKEWWWCFIIYKKQDGFISPWGKKQFQILLHCRNNPNITKVLDFFFFRIFHQVLQTHRKSDDIHRVLWTEFTDHANLLMWFLWVFFWNVVLEFCINAATIILWLWLTEDSAKYGFIWSKNSAIA